MFLSDICSRPGGDAERAGDGEERGGEHTDPRPDGPERPGRREGEEERVIRRRYAEERLGEPGRPPRERERKGDEPQVRREQRDPGEPAGEAGALRDGEARPGARQGGGVV